MAADKRMRKRRIPDVEMPPAVASYFHDRLIVAADRLEEAAQKPATAVGAVERLAILEGLLPDLVELRALLTAWVVEDGMGEAPIQAVADAVGVSGTTVSRRYGGEQVRKLRELG